MPNRTLIALAPSPLAVATPAFGGAYAASGSGITYPSDYDGNDSGTLEVEICLVPSMSGADVAQVERPVRNGMARWSKGAKTSGTQSTAGPDGSFALDAGRTACTAAPTTCAVTMSTGISSAAT